MSYNRISQRPMLLQEMESWLIKSEKLEKKRRKLEKKVGYWRKTQKLEKIVGNWRKQWEIEENSGKLKRKFKIGEKSGKIVEKKWEIGEKVENRRKSGNWSKSGKLEK